MYAERQLLWTKSWQRWSDARNAETDSVSIVSSDPSSSTMDCTILSSAASCPTFHPISRCPGSGEWGGTGKLVASSIFILNPVLTSGGVHILGHARVITIQARLEQHHFWLGFRLRVACEPHHELVVFEVRSVLVFDGRILPVLVPGTSCLVPWYVRELNVRVRECTRAGQLQSSRKEARNAEYLLRVSEGLEQRLETCHTA